MTGEKRELTGADWHVTRRAEDDQSVWTESEQESSDWETQSIASKSLFPFSFLFSSSTLYKGCCCHVIETLYTLHTFSNTILRFVY
ncbi:uncharacterized protein HKW66_Vig0146240 [Vigna angularis]|uniref:Uncharacterized protein n=1 Tax=Phaseolus angularis TaxID=3914 RepID=A0A8T0KBF2_PHAAN|nr:uncharacterized protein HKW66_Vig0146240 [Vigna angularis]